MFLSPIKPKESGNVTNPIQPVHQQTNIFPSNAFLPPLNNVTLNQQQHFNDWFALQHQMQQLMTLPGMLPTMVTQPQFALPLQQQQQSSSPHQHNKKNPSRNNYIPCCAKFVRFRQSGSRGRPPHDITCPNHLSNKKRNTA